MVCGSPWESVNTKRKRRPILVQPLYVAAWREVEGLDPESLINLLVYFRLAAEVKTDLFYDPSVKQYFLPLVLRSVKESSVSPGYNQRATPLHLTFRTEFVPPGFFTRFIATIAKSRLCQISFNKGVFRNRVNIKFGDPPIDQVILRELHHAIQVDVLRYAPECDSLGKFTHVCQKLHGFLIKVAKEVDTCLFGSLKMENNNNESEYGKVYKEIRFVCAAQECQSTSDCHYLNHVNGQSRDLNIYCEKSDVYRNVLPEEGLWFCEKILTSKVCVFLNKFWYPLT